LKKVLFVCVKNSSRSPMAEALTRLYAKGWEPVSAGIQPGTEPNPEAVKAMGEIGLDLGGHRPKHISAFQGTTFDLVVKMDAPDLSDFVHARWMENWDIPDPANGGIDEFRKVRDLLAQRVRDALGSREEAERDSLSRAA
jgi:protein-tyrosine-phosphatase